MQENSRIVKTVIGQKAISFENGRFVMMGVLGMPLPISSIINFYNLGYKKDRRFLQDSIYYVGKAQCSAALTYTHEVYGYSMKDTFDSICQQVQLIGGGIMEVSGINLDTRVMILKNNNSPFAEQFKKLCGTRKEGVCHFLRGICAALFEEIVRHEVKKEQEMVAIEMKCIAKGNPMCVFEVRPRDRWDMKLPIVKEQMPSQEFDFEEMKRISNPKSLLA